MRFLGCLTIIFLIFFEGMCPSRDKSNSSNRLNWEGMNPRLKDSILILKKLYKIEFSESEYESMNPKRNKLENWIYQNASTEELFLLTNHPGSIKKLAYRFLIYRDHDCDKFELIKDCLNDTTTIVTVRHGGEINDLLLGEYLAEEVVFLVDNGLKPPWMPERLKFSDEQLSELRELYQLHKSKRWDYIMSVNESE